MSSVLTAETVVTCQEGEHSLIDLVSLAKRVPILGYDRLFGDTDANSISEEAPGGWRLLSFTGSLANGKLDSCRHQDVWRLPRLYGYAGAFLSHKALAS